MRRTEQLKPARLNGPEPVGADSERLIAKTFACQHMSDTKWRKAFRILIAPHLGLRRCRVKWVGNDAIGEYPLPPEDCLGSEWIREYGGMQYSKYRWLETVEIPARFIDRKGPSATHPREASQPAGAAEAELRAKGQFPLEPLPDGGFLLRGYSK